MTTMVQYCECALGEYKTSNSTRYASKVCSQKLQYNTLAVVDQETQHLYENLIGTSSTGTVTVEKAQPESGVSPLSIIGGTFAIVLVIASFVGGLLGWLLVMKKRVLRCSVCSATVRAS